MMREFLAGLSNDQLFKNVDPFLNHILVNTGHLGSDGDCVIYRKLEILLFDLFFYVINI